MFALYKLFAGNAPILFYAVMVVFGQMAYGQVTLSKNYASSDGNVSLYISVLF